MKANILLQISELNQEYKSRLYEVIETFLFDNEVDITKEQDKEKVAITNNCPHCEPTKIKFIICCVRFLNSPYIN